MISGDGLAYGWRGDAEGCSVCSAAEGMANKEIAQALFVTVKAVEVHLSSVYRKLQIKSRTQLADAISGPR